MVTKTTDGVKVTVTTEYQEEYSSPAQFHYVFSYKVTIQNFSDYTVQLQRRHWYIFDSDNSLREVEGEGVIGQQPTLEPGNTHQYVSGCNLRTPIGKMNGTYLMERVMDGKKFEVKIPEFIMIAPFKLN